MAKLTKEQADFICRWNATRYPFLCLKSQRHGRKKMIRFNQIRKISMQNLVNIMLTTMDNAALEKIGFYRKSNDDRIEVRRSELIEWLMEEV